ncbi:MAG TPA: glycosyltransferase family 2 protein [Burkholderiales bacterium]|jgi:glycosyltransferase|nr:glycosyltransferase family 2 protein [Burkholderiales bacterium]
MSAADQPRITVITVVYNGERFIESTIKSVLSQDYPDLQYIVIDGGSSDGTVEIIRRHAARLSNWVSESDQGISDAFNKGIDRASGDYLMFLNADDELADAQALTRLVDCARARNWPDVIYGDCDLYDADGAVLLHRVAIDYNRARFLRSEVLPHPSMLTHRRYFEKYGRFDTSFKVAMDYDLFLRGIPELGAIRAPVLVSKVRFGGISTRNRRLVVDEVIRALMRNGRLDLLGAARLRLVYAVRGAARRMLEIIGLYRFFNALRSRSARRAHGGKPGSAT